MASRLSTTYVPLCDMCQRTCPFDGPLPSPDMVTARPSLASLDELRFRNPQLFKAGEFTTTRLCGSRFYLIEVLPLWI